jgi:hypothetical protein
MNRTLGFPAALTARFFVFEAAKDIRGQRKKIRKQRELNDIETSKHSDPCDATLASSLMKEVAGF